MKSETNFKHYSTIILLYQQIKPNRPLHENFTKNTMPYASYTTLLT